MIIAGQCGAGGRGEGEGNENEDAWEEELVDPATLVWAVEEMDNSDDEVRLSFLQYPFTSFYTHNLQLVCSSF